MLSTIHNEIVSINSVVLDGRRGIEEIGMIVDTLFAIAETFPNADNMVAQLLLLAVLLLWFARKKVLKSSRYNILEDKYSNKNYKRFYTPSGLTQEPWPSAQEI